MEIVKLDINHPDPSIIKKAARIIESGGVVIHPTDTAYGLAVNALDENAVAKIFAIKGRDLKKGLIVAVKDEAMAKTLVEFSTEAETLFATLLPGPLTLLLPKRPTVPSAVSGDSNNLAIRMPNCAVTLDLSKTCSVPYTTTSANPAGRPTPYSIEQIVSEFAPEILNRCDLILDCGAIPQTAPSTIVDVSNKDLKIIRQGPISLETMNEALRKN